MNAIKLVFPLTLNKSDRAAIDWVGYRYSHGDELAEFLCDALPQGHSYEDFNFSDVEGDVQFDIPESEMSEYERLITEDSMACFSDELKHKLMTPLHHYLGGRSEDEEQPEENPSMMGRKLLCHACGSEHEVVGIKVVNKVFDATEVYKLSCGHATM